MSHLRNWLNQRGIEPAIFECYDEGLGNQTYEVSFPDRGKLISLPPRSAKAPSVTNTNPGPPGRDPFQSGQGLSSEPESIFGWLHATDEGQR
jgi:hypothetical protein